MLLSTPIDNAKFAKTKFMQLKSLDQTKHDNHRRNVVNVYCDRSGRNENTSRSSTPVSIQQITGHM